MATANLHELVGAVVRQCLTEGVDVELDGLGAFRHTDAGLIFVPAVGPRVLLPMRAKTTTRPPRFIQLSRTRGFSRGWMRRSCCRARTGVVVSSVLSIRPTSSSRASRPVPFENAGSSPMKSAMRCEPRNGCRWMMSSCSLYVSRIAEYRAGSPGIRNLWTCFQIGMRASRS